MRILITGGAGYIGSHVVLRLIEDGHSPLVFDNLVAGSRSAVPGIDFVRGDLADRQQLEKLFDRERFDAVMHFAAHIEVEESERDPLKYYWNNTAGTLGLVDCCLKYGVKRFIFSSTAAVYGVTDAASISEDAALSPLSPYGASKMMSERVLTDAANSSELRFVIFRYFNVAGADLDGRTGQRGTNCTHLIKVACETVLGMHPHLTIYGTDYDTPDGTCVRDYIHVQDLAGAHVEAVNYLGNDNAPSQVFNCGYGRGFSVREVIDAVNRASGSQLKVVEGPRRAGDPPALVADRTKIGATLDWKPQYNDLDVIVSSALNWEKQLQGQRAHAAAH